MVMYGPEEEYEEYYRAVATLNGKKVGNERCIEIDPRYEYINLEELLDNIFGIKEPFIDFDASTFPCYCGDAWGRWGATAYLGRELLKGDAWGCCGYTHVYFEDSKGNVYRIDIEPITREEYMKCEEE